MSTTSSIVEAKTAIITGAGSGVGAALALRLAAEGWRLALIGRRQEALEAVRRQAKATVGQISVHPCDIGDSTQVTAAITAALAQLGHLTALINSAGTNAPRRSLAEIDIATYQELVNTNLNGTFYATHAVLPTMRKQGGGSIINIVSDAGLHANAKAGPGYVAAKFGVTGLTQSINLEERAHGIRATAIFPGDINTPLLDKRPSPPSAEARAGMLQPDDVVDCVVLALRLPAHAIIEHLTIRPR